jgi:hypothetical protein
MQGTYRGALFKGDNKAQNDDFGTNFLLENVLVFGVQVEIGRTNVPDLVELFRVWSECYQTPSFETIAKLGNRLNFSNNLITSSEILSAILA